MKCENCGNTVPDGLTICNVCKKPVVSMPKDRDTVMCPCCGESNFKGITICSKCGTALTADGPEHREHHAPVKKKKKTRLNPKFVAAVIIIFAVIAAAVAAIIISVVKKNDSEPKKVMSFFAASENYTSYFADGEKIYNLTGLPTIHSASLDGTAEAVVSGNGTLRYISSEGVIEIAENNVISCVISQNGGAIAYLVKNTVEETTEPTSENQSTTVAADETETEPQTQPISLNTLSDYSLFLFDCSTGESAHIANNVNSGFIALSPNGKSVAYTIGTSDNSGFESYICSDGIYTSTGKNIATIALSDDNAYSYYLKYETSLDREVIKLFVKDTDSETKLGEFAGLSGLVMYFSSDCSELIFSLNGDDGNFFISTNAEEKKKLSTGFTPIFPYGSEIMPCEGACRTYFCPVASYAGLVFTDSVSVVRSLDSEYACIDVSDNSTKVQTVADNSAVYYLDSNEYLYSCPVNNITKAQQIAEHITEYEVSADGSMVYYINGDSELHCVKGENDNLISEKVYKMWLACDGTVYFLESYSSGSGTLCYCANGKDKQPIDGADNVLDVIPDFSESVYYRSDYSEASGVFDLWYGSKDKTVKICEDIG